MRKIFMNRYAKKGGAPRHHFLDICEKPQGGVQTPPGWARVKGDCCESDHSVVKGRHPESHFEDWDDFIHAPVSWELAVGTMTESTEERNGYACAHVSAIVSDIL